MNQNWKVSKLKEQDSNPHLKDPQIFKMSKLRLEVLLERKNYTTLGETHCWKSHQTNWKYKNIVVLKKNEHVSMLNMVDPRD